MRPLKFQKETFELYRGDCFKLMRKLDSESVDCIITDPPYFLSNGGVTCQGGRMVSVNKGEWDVKSGYNDFHQFNLNWINESYRLLKPGGTLWISGTLHNIYTIGNIIESIDDFKILNNITWIKKSPPPNLSCRMFTHSTETILWVRKGLKSKHFFNYPLMKEWNGGKQMKDVWTIGRPKKIEKQFGKHPTQKPEELLERMIQSSTSKGDLILDMFNGSGTTGVVAVRNDRRFIGIDNDNEFYKISKKRLLNEIK